MPSAPCERRTSGRTTCSAGFLSLAGGVGFYSLFLLLALTAILFPDGRLPSPRWRIPVAVVAAPLVVAVPIALIKPGPVDVGLANNPLGIELDALVQLRLVIDPLSTLAVPALLVLGAAAVLVRFRRASGDTREQLKWLLAAVAVVAMLVAMSFAQPSEGMSPSAVMGVASLSPSCRSRSASRSCAIGCTRSIGSSAGRSAGPS